MMENDNIKILANGKLDEQWIKYDSDIIFYMERIEIESTFNFDEDDEDLREYQNIYGKLKTLNKSYYLEDEKKSNKEKLAIKSFETYKTIEITLMEAETQQKDIPIKFEEYDKVLFISVELPKTIFKSMLKQMYGNNINISLHVDFNNCYYDSYAPEIFDMYIGDDKGIVNSIEINSKMYKKKS